MNRITIKALLNSLIHTTHWEPIIRNVLRKPYRQYSDRQHLEATIDWLCASQDNSGCKGCAGAYGFDKGWAPPYPETTGYIISTILRFVNAAGDNSLLERAIQMGDWEIDIQLPTGAVRGGIGINDYPIVFNTGMVILGWADLFEYTGKTRFLEAATRAADWLCANLEENGTWINHTYKEKPHAYHSRVAWSLLEVYKHTSNRKYKDAARRNIEWVVSLASKNGWIEEMGFYEGEIPLTHTIAYTLRGLLECSHYFDDPLRTSSQEIVIEASKSMLKYLDSVNSSSSTGMKFLPGRFNNKWQNSEKYSCLTGNAQIAIILIKIFRLNADHCFLDAAIMILDELKKLQNLTNTNPGIRGGIAGSYPIWGDYLHFAYPNWSAKFFADALMLRDEVTGEFHKGLSVNV